MNERFEEFHEEELAVMKFALESARKNCIEPDGIGSYGGTLCDMLLTEIERVMNDGKEVR